MKPMDRRDFLRCCAAGACAAAAPMVPAAPCVPRPPVASPDARPVLAFLDDRRSPQGARLDELLARLAAHGLGTRHARLEVARVEPGDAHALGCAIETLSTLAPLAFCTASQRVAAHALAHIGSIPLVFAVASDPVAAGLVDALGPRRVNATGFTYDTAVPIDLKCFELIAEAYPRARRVRVLADEAWLARPGRDEDLRRIRRRLGLDVVPLEPAPAWEAAEALRRVPLGPEDACYLPQGEALLHDLAGLVGVLQQRRIPHLCGDERALGLGAMLVYAPRRLAHWDAMASTLRLIVQGRPASEIPVQRPMEFLLWLGLAQWRRLGRVPPGALLRRAHVAA